MVKTASSSCSANAVHWMMRHIVSRLSRKHVRQDEPDHPGYDVEAQEYFCTSVSPHAHDSTSSPEFCLSLIAMNALHDPHFQGRCRRHTSLREYPSLLSTVQNLRKRLQWYWSRLFEAVESVGASDIGHRSQSAWLAQLGRHSRVPHRRHT